MKLGIWCDFGSTLEPNAGIGVFVANLVETLANQPSIEEILLVAKAGEEHKLEPLQRKANELSTTHSTNHLSDISRVNNTPQGINPSPHKPFKSAPIRIVGNPKPPFVIRKLWKTLRKTERKRLYPTFGPSPSHKKSWWCSPIVRFLDGCATRSKQQWLDSVDLWLLPYVGLDHPFSKPTVVVLHDLVTVHFPESIRPSKLASFKLLVSQVTDRATIVACMSDFILKNDLLGTLGLDKSRTAMVRPAIPRDFSSEGQQATNALSPNLAANGITPQGYLLYPAGFRSYKNHALLVDALHALSQESSDELRSLQVVFTGSSDLPADLTNKINALGVGDRLRLLGKVTRSELESLYRNAYATVVPSLYEQGSFPLMESLHFGCPILSSDIPSLREQLQAMGSSALFFDPRSVQSLVQSLRELSLDRQGKLKEQLEGFRAMQARTWDDVAKEWCVVFDRALSM